MIRRLVEMYGADVNHVHSKDVVSGSKILLLSCVCSVAEQSVCVAQQQGRTALFAAAEMGWTEAIEELVRLGANIHTVLQVRLSGRSGHEL
jgi:hypothetical protein